MIKKLFVIMTITTVMVASIASICLASRGLNSSGLNTGYNGSYYYNQGWANFYADDHNYNVKVGVVKSSGTYGKKTTKVTKGNTKTCYSLQVQGSDGITAWVQYSATA